MSDTNNTAVKRHCMVVHAYYPLGETRVEREALALVARGYEVDVICLRSKNQPEFSDENGVNVYRLPARRRVGQGVLNQFLEYLNFFLKAFFKVTSLHRQKSYGVVQLHNLPDFLVFAGLGPKLMGAKLILDIHDVMPEFYAARFGTGMGSLPVRLVTLQEQVSCWFADHVITVTELWRQTLIERGVKAEKTSVVMNVADSRLFHLLPPEQMPEKDDSRFKLIYHGTLSPRYGLAITVRAIDIVRREVPNVHFTIHGGGDLWRHEVEKLQNLVEELGLQDHVYFSTEFVAIEELPDLVRRADVGVVSYRRDVFTDGILPTKVMEYIALGMPVVAARSPVMDSYFDDSQIQFFTPESVDDMAKAIIELYKDKQRQLDLVEACKRFKAEYGWDKVSADYVALIDRLGAS